jgi:hypothetical protein
MHTLASYLTQRLPRGMAYPDARQLCLRLYGTADGVPEVLRPQLTRVGLADTFAELARAGWIREAIVQATQSSHWVEVISSIFKQGADVVDIPRGEVLAREVGFIQGSLS